MSALLKLGIPVYPSPERAVRALAALRKATCRKT
jgi:acyl-CoA synthetase (NDP forming)